MTVPVGAALRRRPLRAVRGLGRPPGPNQQGFTLLELLVVFGTIAVLVGIGVPTFLSAQQRSENHAAQSDLRNALIAANTAYVDQPDFGLLNASALTGVETSLHFSDSAVSNRGAVHVVPGTCNTVGGPSGCVALAEPAGNGTCWFIVQPDDGAAAYGKGAAVGGVCNAHDAESVPLAPEFPA